MMGRSLCRPDGLQRRPQLGHVAERLEDEALDPAVEQPADLALVNRAGLVQRELAERLDPDTERAERAEHGRALAGRLARQPGRRAR